MNGEEIAIYKDMCEKPPILIGLKGKVLNGLRPFEELEGQLRCLSAIGLILIYPMLFMDNLGCIYSQDPYGKLLVKEGITVIGSYGPLIHPDEACLSSMVLIGRLSRTDIDETDGDEQQ